MAQSARAAVASEHAKNATSRRLNTHSSSTYAHMARSPARAPMAAGRAPMAAGRAPMANSSATAAAAQIRARVRGLGLTPRSRKTRRAYGRSSREGSSGPAELGTAGASTGRASMPAGQAAAGPAGGRALWRTRPRHMLPTRGPLERGALSYSEPLPPRGLGPSTPQCPWLRCEPQRFGASRRRRLQPSRSWSLGCGGTTTPGQRGCGCRLRACESRVGRLLYSAALAGRAIHAK